MRAHWKKKTVVLTLGLTLVVGGGGAAFAYWTAGGTGGGTATTGTNVALAVNQTSAVTAMAPGVGAQTLTGTFTNTNAGPVYVGTVTAAIGSVTKAGVPVVGCDYTDYTLTNPVMDVKAEIPSGTGVGSWSGAAIQFNDKTSTNQDACKGATVNLTYTIG
jgi:hypothetical protein